MMLTDIDIERMLVLAPPALDPATVFRQLLRLDSVYKPGLTVEELVLLLAKCSRCRLVMTRRIYESHVCDKEIVVIDLTLDT